MVGWRRERTPQLSSANALVPNWHPTAPPTTETALSPIAGEEEAGPPKRRMRREGEEEEEKHAAGAAFLTSS